MRPFRGPTTRETDSWRRSSGFAGATKANLVRLTMILRYYTHMVRLFSCTYHPKYLLIQQRNPALVTGQLAKEIHEVSGEIESLFGVLNEDLLQLQ